MPMTRVSKDFKKLLKDTKKYFEIEEGIRITDTTLTQIIAKKTRPKDLNIFEQTMPKKQKCKKLKAIKKDAFPLTKMFR